MKKILLYIVVFSCVFIAKAQDRTKEYPQGAVFYEIFIRSFADSDGDGIGDIQGIISKLDYLQDLGIRSIWLTPFNPSPTYHKYDVTDYMNVDPEYGSLQDVKNLIEQAHKRNIRVIMDFVVNHTSNQHPWFLQALQNPQSAYRNYYLWAQESESHLWQAKPYNPGLPWQWHIIDSNAREKGRYYGFFWRGMPDLNYDNPKVRNEIIKAASFWIKEIGIDGLRLDAAQHIYDLNEHEKSRAWWADFRKEMERIKPDIYLVGEVMATDTIVSGYFRGLQANFHFDLGTQIIKMAREEQVIQKFVENLQASYSVFSAARPDFIPATLLTNHDQNRVMSELAGNQRRAATAAAILLTLPGQPYLYYGEEVGMCGQKPDELIREPIRWNEKGDAGTTSWLQTSYTTATGISVDKSRNIPTSLFNTYKNLIHFRNQNPALLAGTLEPYPVMNNQVLAYIRTEKTQKLLIIHNLSNMPQPLPIISKQYRQVFGTLQSGNLLPPHSCTIYLL